MITRVLFSVPIALSIAVFTEMNAYGASCLRWVAQCKNRCTQFDEYGNSPEEHASELDVQHILLQALSLFPPDAKTMTWHADKNGRVVVDEVKK